MQQSLTPARPRPQILASKPMTSITDHIHGTGMMILMKLKWFVKSLFNRNQKCLTV